MIKFSLHQTCPKSGPGFTQDEIFNPVGFAILILSELIFSHKYQNKF